MLKLYLRGGLGGQKTKYSTMLLIPPKKYCMSSKIQDNIIALNLFKF